MWETDQVTLAAADVGNRSSYFGFGWCGKQHKLLWRRLMWETDQVTLASAGVGNSTSYFGGG